MEQSAAKPLATQSPELQYVDRPECRETFADSINSMVFDGQTLRIEFGVTRVNEVRPDTPLTGRRYPACRLVLPPAAAIELINRIQRVASALTRAGIAKPLQKFPSPTEVENVSPQSD
jgi:hypothetical protein